MTAMRDAFTVTPHQHRQGTFLRPNIRPKALNLLLLEAVSALGQDGSDIVGHRVLRDTFGGRHGVQDRAHLHPCN